MDNSKKIIGPFRQILTMQHLPLKGRLLDGQLEIIDHGGICVDGGCIEAVGPFEELKKNYKGTSCGIEYLDDDLVALPGFIDAHTHICYAGNRASDYAARNNGKSYLEIAKDGGGIWSTVESTRKATKKTLAKLMENRMDRLLSNGIVTIEIKSGYGLSVEHELNMLRAIREVKQAHQMSVIATCLAAHIVPKEIKEEEEYLQLILDEIVPIVKKEGLCDRFDIFIEGGAFSAGAAKGYLQKLRKTGFQLTIHGDQFTTGGSQLAIDCGAISVDHLEASGDEQIKALSKSEVIPVILPGASIGLGSSFGPARKLLDSGCSLVIASDWNPGSAPQGNLLAQASILGAFEKLTGAEVFSGVTFRAARVLGLDDRGKLAKDYLADIIAFPCSDYRDILYHQGELKVKKVWKRGEAI